MYCPAWIYSIICNEICKNYVTSELDISAFAKKYASKAEQTFGDLDATKLSAGAEAIIRFLGTVEGVDVVQVCNAFTYNTALFERDGSPRKTKGLFKKDDAQGVKLEAVDEDAEKKAGQMIRNMLQYDMEVYKIDTSSVEDIGSMSPEEFSWAFQNAETIDSDYYFFQKMMQNII